MAASPAPLCSIADGAVPLLSRRRVFIGLGLGAITLTLQGCGGEAGGGVPAGPSPVTSTGMDFASRFAAFSPAAEPDGDLAKVVWPGFVLDAGPEIKQLYEFQVVNGELMRYMPCFCGCKDGAGHRNNRDCYIKAVSADGAVVLDSMAPT